MVLVQDFGQREYRKHMRVGIRVHSPTYIVSFDVWYGQFFRHVLSNGALATSCGAGDDPHVAVVMGGQGSMDLLDRGRGCVVHGRRRNGQGVPCIETEHGHGDGIVSDKDE